MKNNKVRERMIWFLPDQGGEAAQGNLPPFGGKVPGLDLTRAKIDSSMPAVPLAEVLAPLSLQCHGVHLPRPG